MKCKQCRFLRQDIIEIVEDFSKEVTEKFGYEMCPCNRYPQNTMHFPNEPQCGEFQLPISKERNKNAAQSTN